MTDMTTFSSGQTKATSPLPPSSPSASSSERQCRCILTKIASLAHLSRVSSAADIVPNQILASMCQDMPRCAKGMKSPRNRWVQSAKWFPSAIALRAWLGHSHPRAEMKLEQTDAFDKIETSVHGVWCTTPFPVKIDFGDKKPIWDGVDPYEFLGFWYFKIFQSCCA